MLRRFRILLNHHYQANKHSLMLLCQKPIASAMTIIVIATALSLPAIFWILTQNIQKLTNNWKINGHISLYLQAIPFEKANNLLHRIKQMENVSEVNLKSAEQGLAELQAQEGMHDIMQYLSENPLPAVITVTPTLTITPAQLELLYQQFQQMPEIEQAKMDMAWVHRLHAILDFLAKIGLGLFVLLASAVILIIGNTLRLAIQNRQEEIQVLKLIGAKKSFIVRPFLYTGIWYALTGAIVALLLIHAFIVSLSAGAEQLAKAYQMQYLLMGLSFKHGVILLCISLVLGWLGAILSVNRQLAFIEPYK